MVSKNTFLSKSWLLVILFFGLSVTIHASNYYISVQDGDDSRTSAQAQNPATPWKSIPKLNSVFMALLRPGDSILFKRGEVFYGQIIVEQSGSSAQPIVISAYGSGANPVISGFSTLTGWTNYSGNIYWVSLDMSTLNLVTLNGVIRPMGRYPNNTYLRYNAHSGNTSISGESVGAIPFDPSGGEVVIRKTRWILDRQPITSRQSNTLNYSTNNNYGDNSTNIPIDSNGYFIQNHMNTLDTTGEWYYDKTAKRLYMYFGSGSPSDYVVKASSQERNYIINSQNYLTFTNMDFEGANTNGGYLVAANNIVFNDCNFRQQGGNGFYGIGINNLTIKGGSISNSLNNGISIDNPSYYGNFEGLTVYNSGLVPGATKSGEGAGQGIALTGDNNIIQKCSVINSGLNGINFEGNNNTVTRNFVDSFCLNKDDGGGIYTYTSDYSTISNNIILHGIGSYGGAAAGYWNGYWEYFGKAAGVYLDNGVSTRHATVTGNTIANSSGAWSGIILNNNGGNTITNNTIYDFGQEQLLILEYSAGIMRNIAIKNNLFVAKSASESTFKSNLYVDENPSIFGVIDSNYHARPIDDSLTIQTSINGANFTARTLANWQAYAGVDAHSHKSPKPISDESDLFFQYNYSASPITVALEQNHTYVDMRGINYYNTITIAPYSSVVLIKINDGGLTSVLPLKLVSFTAQLVGSQTNLAWQTVNESNVSGFEVQRMVNSGAWEKIGFVQATNNAASANNYSFVDKSPSIGSDFYRLKVTDLDGKFFYSDVVTIELKTSQNMVYQNMPNPFSGSTTIRYDLKKASFVKIVVFNEVGAQVAVLVNGQNDLGSNRVQWNAQNLPAGNYFCTINIGDEVKTLKMIKIN
ncbi:MAG: T9SS type A sorting domain-containing protein [Chitinophagaceae bacterium]